MNAQAISSATRFPILDRHKKYEFAVSRFDDFSLGDGDDFDVRQTLVDSRLSLYTLDLERKAACFVELPRGVDLATEPFYFRAQFLKASHLITIPLNEFNALASELACDDSRLVLIQSVGRCGSTLVSRVFESIETVHSLSEPDVFTNLAAWRGSRQATDSDIRQIAKSSVKFCFRPAGDTSNRQYFALKFRSQCLEIDDLLADAFPAARHLYLTRDPLSWLDSNYRAFIDPERVEDRDYRAWVESFSAPMYPLIRQQVIKGQPMPIWKSMILNWIANSESFRRLRRSGIDYCVADFSELQSSSSATLERLLDYCDVNVPDWSVIDECLARDSQQGSGLAQDLINDPARQLPAAYRLEAHSLLRRYGYANSDVISAE